MLHATIPPLRTKRPAPGRVSKQGCVRFAVGEEQSGFWTGRKLAPSMLPPQRAVGTYVMAGERSGSGVDTVTVARQRRIFTGFPRCQRSQAPTVPHDSTPGLVALTTCLDGRTCHHALSNTGRVSNEIWRCLDEPGDDLVGRPLGEPSAVWWWEVEHDVRGPSGHEVLDHRYSGGEIAFRHPVLE